MSILVWGSHPFSAGILTWNSIRSQITSSVSQNCSTRRGDSCTVVIVTAISATSFCSICKEESALRCVEHPFLVPVEELTLGWPGFPWPPRCLFLPWRLDALIKTRKLLKTDPANEILFSAMLRDEK